MHDDTPVTDMIILCIKEGMHACSITNICFYSKNSTMLSCSSTITFITPGRITITFNIHINVPHQDLIPKGIFTLIQTCTKLNMIKNVIPSSQVSEDKFNVK